MTLKENLRIWGWLHTQDRLELFTMVGKVFRIYFALHLQVLGIGNVPTTNKNPLSNAKYEHMHQQWWLCSIHYCFTPHTHTIQGILPILDDGLATTMYLMWTTVSMVPKASPRALAFSHDMLLNIPLIAEWQTINSNWEAWVNNTLLKSNQLCINYYSFLGQWVLNYDQNLWPLWDCLYWYEWYCHYTILGWCDWANIHSLHYPLQLPSGMSEGSVTVGESVDPTEGSS